jgi:hypothetical protein
MTLPYPGPSISLALASTPALAAKDPPGTCFAACGSKVARWAP